MFVCVCETTKKLVCKFWFCMSCLRFFYVDIVCNTSKIIIKCVAQCILHVAWNIFILWLFILADYECAPIKFHNTHNLEPIYEAEKTKN